MKKYSYINGVKGYTLTYPSITLHKLVINIGFANNFIYYIKSIFVKN